jgi:hypothetical protein
MKDLTKIARNEYFEMFDGVSDVDFGFNSETGQFDIPSIEWDGVYGTHWTRYGSEEERSQVLKEHQRHMEVWCKNRVTELEEERRLRDISRQESMNTLGNLFPDLFSSLTRVQI